MGRFLTKTPAAAKAHPVWPDGKEKSVGFLTNGINVSIMSYGLVLATKFLSMKLLTISDISMAQMLIMPALLVFLLKSRIREIAIHIKPAFPNVVITVKKGVNISLRIYS